MLRQGDSKNVARRAGRFINMESVIKRHTHGVFVCTYLPPLVPQLNPLTGVLSTSFQFCFTFAQCIVQWEHVLRSRTTDFKRFQFIRFNGVLFATFVLLRSSFVVNSLSCLIDIAFVISNRDSIKIGLNKILQ